MTKHHVATEDKLVIKIMDGYFEQQVQPDIYHDIKEARFADTDVTLDYYKGPKYIIFDHMSVN